MRSFAALHLGKTASAWLTGRGDWLGEALRGLCDRLAIVFTEESFGDPLVASALWAFAAVAMPPECRATCWGMQDPAVLVLLGRALPAGEGGGAAAGAGAGAGALLGPLADYLGPEDPEVLRHAAGVLGLPAEDAEGRGGAPARSSWPGLLALHHRAREGGRPSPLGDVAGGVGGAAAGGSLDEME